MNRPPFRTRQSSAAAVHIHYKAACRPPASAATATAVPPAQRPRAAARACGSPLRQSPSPPAASETTGVLPRPAGRNSRSPPAPSASRGCGWSSPDSRPPPPPPWRGADGPISIRVRFPSFLCAATEAAYRKDSHPAWFLPLLRPNLSGPHPRHFPGDQFIKSIVLLFFPDFLCISESVVLCKHDIRPFTPFNT